MSKVFVHVSRCLIYKVHSAFQQFHSLSGELIYYITAFRACQELFQSFMSHSISLRQALRRKLIDFITSFRVCQELFSNSFDFLKSLFKIRCSLECRCYYTSFSSKVNTKFAVFFHKCRAVPIVRFDVHPHLVCTKKEDATIGVLPFLYDLTLRLQ